VGDVLARAGFSEIDLDGVDAPMWMGSDVDDTCAYLAGHDMARTLLDGKPADAVARAWAAIRGALAPYAGPEGVVLRGSAWLVSARA
jgi:hypothetical protein